MTMERIPECRCEKTHLTRRMQEGGSIAYYMQCLRCGRATSTALAKQKAADLLRRMGLQSLEDLAPWDKKLRDDYEKQISALYAQKALQREIDWNDKSWERTEEYRAYLLTPEWRTRRNLVMRRAEGRCEGCGTADAAHIHHLTYKHRGCEFLFELVALCAGCHERIHA